LWLVLVVLVTVAEVYARPGPRPLRHHVDHDRVVIARFGPHSDMTHRQPHRQQQPFSRNH